MRDFICIKDYWLKEGDEIRRILKLVKLFRLR